jgi:cyclic-di-GMP-binding protein
MAQDCSFDVVSQVDMQSLDNAVNQAMKEIGQRYDFKGALAEITVEAAGLKFAAQDEFKLEAMMDILRLKMVKAGISARALTPGKLEQASKGTVRQVMAIQSGIAADKARAIVASVKNLKLKVQVQIMGIRSGYPVPRKTNCRK